MKVKQIKPLIFYKYCVLNEYTKENLSKNQLYFCPPGYFNDPYEGVFDFNIQRSFPEDQQLAFTKEQAIRRLSEMKICCMSRINDSLLMWAHYAGSHQGLCVAFDAGDPLFQTGGEVKYSDEIYRLEITSREDIQEENLRKKYRDILTTKFHHWHYEKEYRLFSNTGESIGKYRPRSVKAVYFGLRCGREDQTAVRAILASHPQVRYYAVDLNICSYKMKFIELG